MNWPSLARLATCFGLWAAASPSARCQKPLEWRFWGVSDGLTESNTSWLTIDAKGVAWAKHGGTTLTRLDGRSVSFISDPWEGGRLAASGDGDLWQLKGRDLRRYDGARWHAYQTPAVAETAQISSAPGRPPDTNAFVPLGAGRVLVLFPHQIVEFNPSTGSTRVVAGAESGLLRSFISVRQGLNGAVWITGENGVARLQELPQGGGLQWREYIAPKGLTDFHEPREGDGGELFAAASRAGKRVLVRFDRKNWEVFYTGGRDPLRAWRGGDGEIWVADGNIVMRLIGNRREPVEKTEAFSGIVQNTVAGSQGAFWVLTSQGIARHTPPLWRPGTEAGGDDADELVGASCEGEDGAVWFLSSRYLMRFDGAGWKKYPLPPQFNRAALTMESLMTLRDGNIAIANSTPDMLIFHPGSDRFEVVHHPQGRIVRMFGLRHDGNLFAQTLNPLDREDFSVEIFDGRTFQPWLDLRKSWGFWDVRAICETSTGDVWFGSVSGLGLLHNGKYKKFGPENDVTRDGAFAVFDLAPGRVLVGGRKALREFDGKKWTTLHGGMDRVRKISRAADGTLWIASGTGMHRLHNGIWITNGVEEGLPSSVVYSVLADSHGTVWAGTTRGLSRYYPEADLDAPRTLVDEGLNSHTIAPDATVRIVFSGIDKWKMTEAARLLFSSRLDGQAWSPFDAANTAVFSGLKSGSHRFEARAMDRNGNIDPAAAHFEFSVLLPWYRQSAFEAVATAGFLAIFLLLRSALIRHRKVAFDSRHDPLTRLFNRRAFEVALQSEIQSSREEREGVAVFLIDLDKFKPVNDTLGHAAGDTFLQEVARRLESCAAGRPPAARPTLARIGGDEFAIVLPRATRDSAVHFATALVEALRQPCRILNREFKTTASVGISLYPEHAKDVAGLQRVADLAMYDCKSEGGDNFRIFEPRMSMVEGPTARMAGLIRDGLNHGYFSVHYQPIVRPDGDYYAFEALLRLNHPEAGPIPPLEFIPVAEETGQIERLGVWVLAEACRQMALWRSQGHRGLRVSVNVSPLQLANPGFVELVIDVITQAGLDPEGLILEITETAMVSRSDAVRNQLEQLRRIGVRIALDDFGTGYSSLSSLHLLPVDIVKIDRSFTQRLGADGRGGAMLDGIILMAHQLAFEVVAEGVETADQREWLRHSNCELLQGYFYGQPQPAEDAFMKLESACSVFV